MILCEELYFEITLNGAKTALKKFISFMRSGELDEFFPFESDYISYDDSFEEVDSSGETAITISNDDCGIEIDEFDTSEFLDVFCRAAAELDVVGTIYDINDDEFSFISESGDSYYVNARKTSRFNEDDDLDGVD